MKLDSGKKEKSPTRKRLLIVLIPRRTQRKTAKASGGRKKQSSKWFKILIIFSVKMWFTPHYFTLSNKLLGGWSHSRGDGASEFDYDFCVNGDDKLCWKCLRATINANGIIAFTRCSLCAPCQSNVIVSWLLLEFKLIC